jgi:hypothetical protein
MNFSPRCFRIRNATGALVPFHWSGGGSRIPGAALLAFGFWCLLCSLTIRDAVAASIQPITAPPGSPYPVFLGGPTREWSIFEGRKPSGAELRVKFNSTRNTREHTLFVRQDDVKQEWAVALNGSRIGTLFLMEADLIHTISIPADALRDGENELRIYSKASDDILIHSLAIGDDAKTNLLTAGPLTINVNDSGGAPMPARVTIVDSNGTMTALIGLSTTNLAVRPGVIYTSNGSARVALLPGKYTIYATRGPEYSLAKQEIAVGSAPKSVTLTLLREVNTAGWFCSDTHIHTFALSRHGDSMLDERVITLAGEGIELPVATEHNRNEDYTEAAQQLGLTRYFTAVPGNEITTTNGHFNIFPISLSAPPIDHNIIHWPTLLEKIRQTPGVQVAILNHPTDTHSGFTPFASTNFNRVTGKNLRGNFDFTFDAMEVINSGAMRTDWMEPFGAWFALLNRGYKIVGVGSSDCHDVSRFIVGQGRTYIQGNDSDVGKIDIGAACDALKHGRAVVSLGLFAQLKISDASDALDAPQLATGVVTPSASGIGDLHTGSSKFFEANGSVDFPAWMNPEGRTTTTLYANGRPLLVFPFEMRKKPGQPLAFKARFPKPKADTWYVLVAETPGVTNAYWSIARPYQPSSPDWTPAMIGATNPIYLDTDGDGRFTPPRMTAKRLVEAQRDPKKLIESLADYDWAVAVQAAELLHDSGTDLTSANFQEVLKSGTPEVQQAFADYLNTISK